MRTGSDIDLVDRNIAEIERRHARQLAVIADLAEYRDAQRIARQVLAEIEVNLCLARTALIVLQTFPDP